MQLFIEALVKIIGYSMFFYSTWLLVGEPLLKQTLNDELRNWRKKRRIKRLIELNNINNTNNKRTFIFLHLDYLLGSINKRHKEDKVFNFIFLSTVILLITTSVLYMLLTDIIISATLGIFFSAMPYCLLRFKLINKRLRTSNAFVSHFHILLQNYQSTGKDTYYMMMNVVKDIDDEELKLTFMKLLSAIQKDRNLISFNEAINLFMYTINSISAKRFAKLFQKAHLENIDITNPLMDLNEDINNRKKDLLKEKTEKLETVLLGYLSLPVFVLIFFSAYKISGVISFWQIFKMPIPIFFFTLALIMTITSVFLAYLNNKPRTDL